MVFRSLFRVTLGPHHAPTGATQHFIVDQAGKRPFPPFVSLSICQYEGDQCFYLLHETEEGQGADTWHQTVDDAMHQADFEFGVKPSEWEATNYPYK